MPFPLSFDFIPEPTLIDQTNWFQCPIQKNYWFQISKGSCLINTIDGDLVKPIKQIQICHLLQSVQLQTQNRFIENPHDHVSGYSPLLFWSNPCSQAVLITESWRIQNGGCGLAPRPPPTSGTVPPGKPVCRLRRSRRCRHRRRSNMPLPRARRRGWGG